MIGIERPADEEEKDDEADRVCDELIDVNELVHEAPSGQGRGRAERRAAPAAQPMRPWRKNIVTNA